MRHADAVGDTRTISLHHVHTDESLTITFKKNGQYDEEALKKINWIMRDWRKNEATTMDREEIDLLWQVYQESAPRNRSRSSAATVRRHQQHAPQPQQGVARNSQHTLGKAIDFYIPAFRSRRSAPPRCGCRAAASATTHIGLAVRPSRRRQRPRLAAHDARSNW